MRPAAARRRLVPALLAAGLAATLACSKTRNDDQGCAADQAATGGPVLTIPESRHDFGRVVQGEELQHTFVLKNTGSEPLRIEKVKPGFHCTGRVLSDTVPPGQQGSLRVTCRPNLFGKFASTVLIRSNARQGGQKKLELLAQVTPLLRFERDLIELRMPFGEERTEAVRLTGTRAADARLKIDDAGEDKIVATILPAEDGKPQGLRVLCQGKRVGTAVRRIVVATGLQSPAEVSLSITCHVVGTLQVSPTNPYVNLREPGPKVRVITVRSSQPGFAVRNVRVLEGPFSASVRPTGSSGEFRVTVTVEQARMTDLTRAVSGKLLIESNDRTEPNKEVPVFGFGKLRPSAAGRSSADP